MRRKDGRLAILLLEDTKEEIKANQEIAISIIELW